MSLTKMARRVFDSLRCLQRTFIVNVRSALLATRLCQLNEAKDSRRLCSLSVLPRCRKESKYIALVLNGFVYSIYSSTVVRAW